MQADHWQLQQAKLRLSELVRAAQSGPQTITVHGREEAVILSYRLYQRMTKTLLEMRKNAAKELENNDKA